MKRLARSMLLLLGLGATVIPVHAEESGSNIFFDILRQQMATEETTTDNRTYSAIVAGRDCEERSSHDMDCTFRVGRDLELWINGIGQNDTEISFVNSRSEGDYYGLYDMRRRCVVVKPGRDSRHHDVAYISPADGRPYTSARDCERAR